MRSWAQLQNRLCIMQSGLKQKAWKRYIVGGMFTVYNVSRCSESVNIKSWDVILQQQPHYKSCICIIVIFTDRCRCQGRTLDKRVRHLSVTFTSRVSWRQVLMKRFSLSRINISSREQATRPQLGLQSRPIQWTPRFNFLPLRWTARRVSTFGNSSRDQLLCVLGIHPDAASFLPRLTMTPQ